jgi:hypothetical protein
MRIFGNTLALISGGLSATTIFLPHASTLGFIALGVAGVMLLTAVVIFIRTPNE